MRFLAVLFGFFVFLGCDSSPSPFYPSSDTDADTDSDTDADTDSDTDADTDTESDSGTDTDTSCYSVDDCEPDQVCGLETHECYDVPVPGDNQLLFCWDHEGSCSGFSGSGCAYWSPVTWNGVDETPPCTSSPTTCPVEYPAIVACCLKNDGEPDCLAESFFLP